MNWIDEKYKDQLGNREFPAHLRHKGKDGLSALLDEQMPVDSKSRRGGWFFMVLGLLGIMGLAIPLGIWYFGSDETSGSISHDLNNPTEVSPLNDIQSPSNPSNQYDGVVAGDAENKSQSGSDLSSNSNGIEKVRGDSENQLPSDAIVKDGNPSSSRRTPSKSGNTRTNASIAASKAAGQAKPSTGDKENKISNKASKNVSSGLEGNGDLGLEQSNVKSGSTTTALVQADGNKKQTATKEAGDKASNGGVKKLEGDNIAGVSVDDEKDAVSLDNNQVGLASGNEEASLTTNLNKKGEAEESLTQAVISETEGEKLDSSAVEVESTEQEEDAISKAKNTVTSNKLLNLAFADVEGTAPKDYSAYKLLSSKRMSISPWFGVAFVGKTVKGGSAEYLALRQEKEEGVWTTPGGLSFDYYLTSKLTLSIGAGFSEYGEVLKYDYEFSRDAYIDGRVESLSNYENITSPIDSVRVIDGINQGHWTYSFTYGDSDTAVQGNNGKTSWSYIEVPILIGYRLGNGRLKPWGQMGVSLGIPYNQTFRYASPIFDGPQLQSVQQSQSAAANLQWSGVLQAGVDYYINPRISLRANFIGSYQINAAYKFEGIEQRYYRLGMTIGASIIL